MTKPLTVLLLIATTLSVSTNVRAQFQRKATPKEITEQFDQLKNTTTVFFYKKSDVPLLDSLKQAITSAWSLTPIIFEDIKNFDKYSLEPKYSYFAIDGISTTTSPTTVQHSSVHYYLVLNLFKEVTKRGAINTSHLCRIELFPDFPTLAKTASYNISTLREVYSNAVFYNWSPILLRAQLSAVQTDLKNNKRPWLFSGVNDSGLVESLSKDTLYIPERLLVNFNPRSDEEKKLEEDVFAGYKYNYRICTDQELYQIFEVEKRGRYLFEYVKSSSDKFVSIYDIKDQKIVYKKYSGMSYNLKVDDIERIQLLNSNIRH